jgi:hypothetical protein
MADMQLSLPSPASVGLFSILSASPQTWLLAQFSVIFSSASVLPSVSACSRLSSAFAFSSYCGHAAFAAFTRFR